MSAAARPEHVAFNRVSIALARSQSLVASWLPPPSAEDAAAQKTPEQLQKDESALFTPGSDILGVGAEPPKDILDGSFKRNQLSSNERLRQQILGKNAAKGRGAHLADQKSVAAPHLPSKKLERPTKPAKAQDDSDDEEDGRAAMFKSRRKAAPPPMKEETSKEGDSGSEDEVKGRAASKQANVVATKTQERSRKRPVSYLDELLEERSKKKNKKQKAQAEVPVKVAVEKSKADSREEKPTAKEKLPAAEEGPDGFDEETGKATAKSAPAKVSIQHGESGNLVTTAESALLDRSDKNKKKKKKKKKKGETTGQS